MYGTSAQVLKTIAWIQASHKLEVHREEGCKAGAFPPYIVLALGMIDCS